MTSYADPKVRMVYETMIFVSSFRMRIDNITVLLGLEMQPTTNRIITGRNVVVPT